MPVISASEAGKRLGVNAQRIRAPHIARVARIRYDYLRNDVAFGMSFHPLQYIKGVHARHVQVEHEPFGKRKFCPVRKSTFALQIFDDFDAIMDDEVIAELYFCEGVPI